MAYCITDYGVIANLPELQTEKLQAVLDLCRENGGTVVIPAGVYRTGARSTTLAVNCNLFT